jgi:hypothetical protein
MAARVVGMLARTGYFLGQSCAAWPRTLLGLLFGFTWSTNAAAQEEALPASVEIHGFVSQGLIKSTHNNYLADSERGSVDFTEAGINFTHAPSDRLRIGLQIFAHDLGPLGNYSPQFDWYYIDYRFWDWLGIRAGRTKLPFGLYNEVNDIDAARVAILLPQSVYPVFNREFLLAQTGAEVYGYAALGGAGALEYRLYGGTIFLDTDNTLSQLRDFTVPYMFGGRLMWLPPVQGLQLGGSLQRQQYEFDFAPTPEQVAQFEMSGQLPESFAGIISARIPAWSWIASVEYQINSLALAAEYTRSYLEVQSTLLVPQTRTVAEGFYALASYQVAPWFTPGLYFSVFNPDPSGRRGSGKYQQDLALTLRFDINAHWLFKIEGHFMHGTAGLSPALNGGVAVDTLENNWGLLLLKTTAYF